MGLDMYLYAQRRIPVTDPVADQILATLGQSLGDLTVATKEEGYLYLPRWAHSGGDEVARSNQVAELARLLPFVTDESSGGGIAVDGDHLVAHVCAVYWRKANAVHAWFVKNCQADVDDCESYPVHPEQLAQLRAQALEAVGAYVAGKKDEAAALLTPTSGFFFGSTDVDEWYLEDLRHTASEIERVIRLATDPALAGVEFAYHSSW